MERCDLREKREEWTEKEHKKWVESGGERGVNRHKRGTKEEEGKK